MRALRGGCQHPLCPDHTALRTGQFGALEHSPEETDTARKMGGKFRLLSLLKGANGGHGVTPAPAGTGHRLCDRNRQLKRETDFAYC